jgi:hypothetical protein
LAWVYFVFVFCSISQRLSNYYGFKLGRLIFNIRADVHREIGAFDQEDIQKLVELGFPLSHHEANKKGIVLAFKTI